MRQLLFAVNRPHATMKDKGTKVFISYKHSETRDRRNQFAAEIMRAGYQYVGETDDSDDYSNEEDATILSYIKSMVAQSEVTVILLSPRMAQSQWINVEIGFSLQSFNYISKDGIELCHHRNGVIGVLLRGEHGYNWALNPKGKGENGTQYNEDKFCEMVKLNRRNKVSGSHTVAQDTPYCEETDSYITIVREEEFLKNINKYIDQAYKKSLLASAYDIQTTS